MGAMSRCAPRWSNSPRYDDRPHRPNTPEDDAARAIRVRDGQRDLLLEMLNAGSVTREQAEEMAAPYGIVLP
jgi:hypothetical protein